MMYLFRRTLLGLGMAVFALALLSAAACLSTGPAEAPFLAKSNAAMTRMMAAMKIKPFNDVDRDFVAMMMPHHQGAIDMAKAELSYGHNELLRRLAQEIIVTQQQEIVVMRRALVSAVASPSTGPAEAPFLATRHAAITRMMAEFKMEPLDVVYRDIVALILPSPRPLGRGRFRGQLPLRISLSAIETASIQPINGQTPSPSPIRSATRSWASSASEIRHQPI